MNANFRASLLKQIRTWHWVSAGFSLITLFLFAATGFFLNHTDFLKSKPTVVESSAEIRKSDLNLLPKSIEEEKFTDEFTRFIEAETGISLEHASVEWDEEEIFIDIKSAGKNASITILPEDELLEYETTNYGTLTFLKDLHTGRNTGKAWRLYIDIFAIMCVIFTLTGLFLMMFYQGQRKSTWAVVSTGVVLPIVIILIFMHI